MHLETTYISPGWVSSEPRFSFSASATGVRNQPSKLVQLNDEYNFTAPRTRRNVSNPMAVGTRACLGTSNGDCGNSANSQWPYITRAPSMN